MSRIGKLPIDIPSGVKVQVRESDLEVSGPKGKLTQIFVKHIAVAVEGEKIVFNRTSEVKQARSNHGLMRSLVNNMVLGVTNGFSKELQVVGVGYRADVRGKSLVMQLGYSHPIDFPIPVGIEIVVDKQNKITITGIDKQQVGQVAAKIRDFRRPDHYKGKGVRYVDERVRIKAGKTA